MNSLRIHTIFILILFLSITACEVETSWDIENSTSQLVADAIITNENTDQVIYLYQTHNRLNDERIAVTNAQITLSYKQSHYIFKEEIPGKYVHPPIQLHFDSTYQLIISVQNISDTAIAVPTISTELYGYNTQKIDSLFSYEITEGDPFDKLLHMTQVHYNWKSSPEFCTYYGSCEAIQYFYDLNNIDVVKEFGPNIQNIFFPSGTIITRKQFGLSNAHANFLRSFLIETDWRGGLFDMEQASPPTNFKHGTLGWFAVCDVKSDTILIP